MTRDTTTLYYAVSILRAKALGAQLAGDDKAYKALSEAADVIGLEADQIVQRKAYEAACREMGDVSFEEPDTVDFDDPEIPY